MTVFLNGRLIPEAQAVVPISDRGLLYGDGLFEVIRVTNGHPLWWRRHLDRLQQGAAFLKLPVPWSPETLYGFAEKLIERNTMPESVLRITLTRGSGSRGYSPKGATNPTLAMTLHPVPPRLTSIRLITSTFRVPVSDSLSPFKTANKLVQVLARAEAEEHGADEALLLNADGNLAEAAAGNIFWIENGEIRTTPLSAGALPGIARSVVLDLCAKRNVRASERHIRTEQLFQADGVFLTNTGMGIMPASELDGKPLRRSPFVADLQQWYQEAQAAEAGAARPG
jgi:aminodeoxychorismate lyase